MRNAFRALAPAKVNLGLFVGPLRELDGKHELITVMQSVSLADELTIEPAGTRASADQVVCPGLGDELAPGSENLAALALQAFRAATGWDGPPQRLTISKRIPVAAGLGGGSADAAAALRLARAASGGLGSEQLLRSIGAELGADVPAQVAPGRWLAGGAGEALEQLAEPRAPLLLLVIPSSHALATAAVYAEADRLGVARTSEQLSALAAELRAAFADGAPLPAVRALLHNDLERSAVSLCPPVDDALELARAAGAELALVSGSGPTVLGAFAGPGSPGDAADRAEAARSHVARQAPGALLAHAVGEEFARARQLGERE